MAIGRQACALLALCVLAFACGSEEEPKPSGAPLVRNEELAEERGENNAGRQSVALNHAAAARAPHQRARATRTAIRSPLAGRRHGGARFRRARANIAPGLARARDEVVVTATDGATERLVRVTAL
jgi:hypothetical protein